MIKIKTNIIPGGWYPEELDTGIGGSEECIIYLSRALSDYFKNVEVVTSLNKNDHFDTHSKSPIFYRDHKTDNFEYDKLITFKKPTSFKYKNKWIHWSSDVEKPWDISNVDKFVHLTNFHKVRNGWVDSNKSIVIPHGIDTDSLDINKKGITREPGTFLYCSSPDRGLETLLKDWPKIKKVIPNAILKIAYGFKNIRAFSNDRNHQFEKYLISLMNQTDIEYLGQLRKREIERQYSACQYWILPLQRADSELFCLNALKARYCGTIPVINNIGALKETVGKHIPYLNLLKGKLDQIGDDRQATPIMGWDEVVQNYWIPILNN